VQGVRSLVERAASHELGLAERVEAFGELVMQFQDMAVPWAMTDCCDHLCWRTEGPISVVGHGSGDRSGEPPAVAVSSHEERASTASAGAREDGSGIYGLGLPGGCPPSRVPRTHGIVPCGGGGDRLCFAGVAWSFPC
jgi:hypothetical protein